MNRRHFVASIALSGLAWRRQLHAHGLADTSGDWASRAGAAPAPPQPLAPRVATERWALRENELWAWFERQNLVEGQWRKTGITTPIHKTTGEPQRDDGYLSERLVPAEALHDLGAASESEPQPSSLAADASPVSRFPFHYQWQPGVELPNPYPERNPDLEARAREGRPPSDWILTLDAKELRIWLRTIEVPEAGVEGMTFWTHLTRDHSFDAARIAGLTIGEQARLHAAAHFGF